MMKFLRIALLLLALAGCTATQSYTTPEGVAGSNNFIGAPHWVDGVNANVITTKVPAIDHFGDQIVELDPALGMFRPTYVRLEVDLITDSPIAGDLVLMAADIALGVAGAAAVSNLAGGCKGSGCGDQPIYVQTVVDTVVHNVVDVTASAGGCAGPCRRVSQK